MERLVSLLGLFLMVGLAWAMSSHKKLVSPRVVVGGMLLQFIFALLVLKTELGRGLFDHIGDAFQAMLGYVDAGSEFVFGERFKEFYFAFKVLPTIIFFSSLMAVLYYLKVMQLVVVGFGRLMQRTLGTTGPESLAAAANVFLGQTEAPLVVRPYVVGMTRSELMATMVPGFASTAGGVLAAYMSMGIDPGHLIAASVMSAPAGLMIAKVLVPETEPTLAPEHVTARIEDAGENLIEAAAIGASQGMKLAINVAAMLIAFLALIALCDGILGFIGGQFGLQWSLSALLSYLFAPLALIMGVEPADCLKVGELLGIRMVANELVAYEKLAEWTANGSQVELSARSEIILTYSLCGFANFASIGIQIAGIGGIAPTRRTDLAQLGLRAMLGGTLACLMTACIAGVLIEPTGEELRESPLDDVSRATWVDQHDGQLVAEFGGELPARSARSMAALSGDCEHGKLFFAGGDRGRDGYPLGADGETIGRVLDVRAGIDLARGGEHGRPDLEIGIRRVRPIAGGQGLPHQMVARVQVDRRRHRGHGRIADVLWGFG